jgi:hypothetical protein
VARPGSSAPGGPARNGAELRLICLVRRGDSYLVRGSGRLLADAEAVTQVDISFGDAADRRAAAALHIAVRHIQRWCELGTPVALLDSDAGVTLRAHDGTAVPLPRCAA